MSTDGEETTRPGNQGDDETSVPESKIDSDKTIVIPKGERDSSDFTEDIGGYRLLKELGSGGQGAVYLAEDKKLKRKVALKILTGGTLSDRARMRFEREAETTGRLKHPGIARVYELGTDKGILFIAMELVEGMTLEAGIRKTKELAQSDVSIKELQTTSAKPSNKMTKHGSNSGSSQDSRRFLGAIRFLEDTGRALHAAHESGLVHRDIKPANIMMRPDGSACILDFGLVHDESSQEMTLTQSGDVFGTPAYMAPEQVQGQVGKIDVRADVWALGVALYECCTLERPFNKSTRHELFKTIVQDEPTPPSRINSKIPKDLEAIILTAIDKEPERRYASALEFAEDLRRLRQYETIHARPAGRWVKTLRWVQRNRMAATLGSLVILALLFALGVFYVKNDEAQSSLEVANEALAAEKLERQAKQSALKEKTEALKQRTLALSEKSLALADFERLADVKRLQEASSLSDNLWPARPEKIVDLEAWLKKYKPLSMSLSGHADALDRLRLDAAPYTEADREKDYAQERQRRSAILEAQKKTAKQLAEAKDEAAKEKLKKTLEKIATDLSDLDQKIAKQGSWHFANDVKQWKHDVLSELVVGLRSFVDKKNGTYTNVQDRLKSAQSIEEKTIADHKALWAETTASIQASDKFHGLILKPQLGLIPLGLDPDSKLFEFLHLETHKGAIPKRDKAGNIPITEDTGIILVLIPKGKFWMGNQKDDPKGQNYDPDGQSDEELREVTIESDFFLSKYEMTQGQWERSPTNEENPSNYGVGFGKGDSRLKAPVDLRHPVEQVSWTMCTQVLRRVGLELPLEEEWEYAARAETSSIYAGDTNEVKGIDTWGNIAGKETKGIFSNSELSIRDDYIIHAPVGQFQANVFGLFDVLGNVWEWTSTKSGSSYRVYRGGSFGVPAILARVAQRITLPEVRRDDHLGLRPFSHIQR